VDLKRECSFTPRVRNFAIVNLRLHYRAKIREEQGSVCKEILLQKVTA